MIGPIRVVPEEPPRLQDGRQNGTVTPFGTVDSALLRGMRPNVRCTACGRFGHEAGEPECPMYREQNPGGSYAPIEEGPLALEDQVAEGTVEGVAPSIDMDRDRANVEEGVSAPSAADVPVEVTDE